jgi:hypothetical protein
MNPQNPEHITFRPGGLTRRLVGGPLSAGATAKRDLSRYYTMVNLRFESWWRDRRVTNDVWEVIAAFVETRYWDVIPGPETIREQFGSFCRSPLASRFPQGDRNQAAWALEMADYDDVVAIIDHAEIELKSPDDATAGATSAAS